LRIFASSNPEHGGIFKVHAEKFTINQVSDTPDNAIVYNGDITGMKTWDLPELDKEHYIKMAEDRVRKFVKQTA
jgi:hypothetical protein